MLLEFIKPILFYFFSLLRGASHQKMLFYRHGLNVAREKLRYSIR